MYLLIMSNNLNSVAGAQNLSLWKVNYKKSHDIGTTHKNKQEQATKTFKIVPMRCIIFTLSQISRIFPFDEVVQLLQKSFGFDCLVPDYICIFLNFRLKYLEKGEKKVHGPILISRTKKLKIHSVNAKKKL